MGWTPSSQPAQSCLTTQRVGVEKSAWQSSWWPKQEPNLDVWVVGVEVLGEGGEGYDPGCGIVC